MGDASNSTYIPEKDLHTYLEELFKKKSSARENALRTLVKQFETNVRYEFVQNNFVTLIHRCQNCLKRGSALEIDLALQLIGLVVLTLGAGDNAHEVYEELLVLVRELLTKSKLCHAIKVFECLCIVTCVGAGDFVDTERSMEIIWQFLNQETKHSSSVTAAAISGWVLLLSGIDRWNISPKKWKESISYLLKQLEEDDEHVNVASIEALALIFEIGSLEKFSNQDGEYKDIKDGIMDQIKRICNGTKQDTSKILEDDYDKTITLTLGRTSLTFCTWSKLKQISYIRKFLGNGFKNHMKENKHLHNVFNFAPARKCSSDDDLELYKPEFEEAVVRVFVPEVRRENCAWRINKSHNSVLSKGRTKLRNKYRTLAEETKTGHIADEQLD
ncbi:interferon-related developmental regulator 1-like [Solanum pennellii]|uniref:Interferon-related developmental regulator 1-like n=1 Tax=Solanum pennellii TaxID=28526 RepID=A0ABM1H9L8_SOLPN|nr:interferon-related developmental regulator 1-like [Solanum pennellii]